MANLCISEEEDLQDCDITVDDKKPKLTVVDIVADGIMSGLFRRIVIMCGAGISVASGIPDFRSPKSGLYAKIREKYQIAQPELMFDISRFRETPELFYDFVKELNINTIKPTLTHYFFTLLDKKGLLHRVYSQNIDGLETKALLPKNKLVLAHGSFGTASCIRYKLPSDPIELLKLAAEGSMQYCKTCRKRCVCKPDIVFFGEKLPSDFKKNRRYDFGIAADLVLVIGTSLNVYPFASTIHKIRKSATRVYVNKTSLDHDIEPEQNEQTGFGVGYCGQYQETNHFRFDDERKKDFFVCTESDTFVETLCRKLGWLSELYQLRDDE